MVAIYLFSALRVKHCGRLVHYYTSWPHCDYACYRNSLLLTAGKLMRSVVAVLVHIDRFQCVIYPLHFIGRHAEVLKSNATSSSTIVATIWLSGFWKTIPTV